MAYQKTVKLYVTLSGLVLLGVLAFTVRGQEQECQNTPEGRVCRVKQEIRAGAEVSADTQRQLGLVTVNGGCSGTLLNQHWVLTARHCVTVGAPPTVGGPLLPPNQVQITAVWTAQIARAERFYDFRINSRPGLTPERDIILVYLGTSNLGEVNSQRIYATSVAGSGGSSRLSGLLKTTDTVTQYGQGFSTFASGVWGTASAKPSDGLGTYRSAQFTPSNITETHYDLPMNDKSQVGHGGDSGGPSVFTLYGYGSGIAGVQSTCRATDYVSGAPKNWSWATNISFCTYVSTAPFLDELYYAIKETPQSKNFIRDDFNKDGFGDILWYNASTGESQIWYMNSSSRIGRATITDDANRPALIGPPWRIVGSRDFNNDGYTDLLWHNSTTSETQIWSMNKSKRSNTATVLGEDGKAIFVGLPWSIVGTNKDDKAQIIWHNRDTGEMQLWRMNDNKISGRATILGEDGKPFLVGSPWSIVGSGDFNNDGKPDILWHNETNNETQIWLVNGRNVTGRRTVLDENGKAVFIGSPWSIVGANDFNQDGAADILWHNKDNGETQVWFMKDHTIVRRATVDADRDNGGAMVGLPWSIMRH